MADAALPGSSDSGSIRAVISPLYTIGHSTHPIDRFAELLAAHDITALGDVRSFPRSRFNPQFNRDRLEAALRDPAIAYVFLGDQLGGKPHDPAAPDQSPNA